MSVDPTELKDFFANSSLGAPDRAIGFVLWRLNRRFQREMDRALAGLDLTYLQFATLAIVAWINRSGEPVTQAELARQSDIEPMQVSQMLKVLEAKGWVARRAAATNASAKHTEITETGLATLRAAMPKGVDVHRRLFGDHGRPGSPALDVLLAMLE